MKVPRYSKEELKKKTRPKDRENGQVDTLVIRCPHCNSDKVIAWGPDADKCETCNLTWSV